MLKQLYKAAEHASWQLAVPESAQKDQALQTICDSLGVNDQCILDVNEQNMADTRRNVLSEALLDRPLLVPSCLSAIAADMRQVCSLTDPVGQMIGGQQLNSSLKLERRRLPLRVTG